MRRDALALLVSPRTRARFDLDPIRTTEDEIVEAFLVARDDLDVRPVFAGVAVLPLDLDAHLRSHGSVYKRSPINDPRLARFLLSRAGAGYDAVRFDEVVAHYRDLAVDPPSGYSTDPDTTDVALTRTLDETLGGGPRRGRGLVVGCGVGRAVFVLCVHLASVLGLDRSIACVRRSRNIAVTNEHFFLPAPKDSDCKEIPIQLDGLVRDGADFAVADACALPLPDAALDVVVVAGRDAQGEWEDAETVTAEARRVLRDGGLLVWHDDLHDRLARTPLPVEHRVVPWRAARVG